MVATRERRRFPRFPAPVQGPPPTGAPRLFEKNRGVLPLARMPPIAQLALPTLARGAGQGGSGIRAGIPDPGGGSPPKSSGCPGVAATRQPLRQILA
eukprot:2987136-Alexandrium_andersonii.AAC.1